MEETIIKQQQESIKLSKMSKGYQWEIRVFVEKEDDVKALGRIDFLNEELVYKLPEEKLFEMCVYARAQLSCTSDPWSPDNSSMQLCSPVPGTSRPS